MFRLFLAIRAYRLFPCFELRPLGFRLRTSNLVSLVDLPSFRVFGSSLRILALLLSHDVHVITRSFLSLYGSGGELAQPFEATTATVSELQLRIVGAGVWF